MLTFAKQGASKIFVYSVFGIIFTSMLLLGYDKQQKKARPNIRYNILEQIDRGNNKAWIHSMVVSGGFRLLYPVGASVMLDAVKKWNASVFAGMSGNVVGGFAVRVVWKNTTSVLVNASFFVNENGYDCMVRVCDAYWEQVIMDECVLKCNMNVVDVAGLNPLSKLGMMFMEGCGARCETEYVPVRARMRVVEEGMTWFGERSSNETLFPKIMHQTWFGPIDRLGRHKRQLMNACRAMHEAAGWRYMLWTDENVSSLYADEGFGGRLVNQDWFRVGAPIVKSDLVRLEVVFKYGGVYIDGDTECLRPFDPLHETLVQDGYECYAGIEMKEKRQFTEFPSGLIAQGTLGCVPRSRSMMVFMTSLFYVNRNNPPWIASGPYQWSTVLRDYALPVKLLSSHVFYPHHHGDGPQAARVKTVEERQALVAAGSYANHHWGTTHGTWLML
jgi:hypothetical protein